MVLRYLFLLCACSLLACCQQPKRVRDEGVYRVDARVHAQSAFPRIDTLVLHYTAGDFVSSLQTLTGPNVSAHYLIPEVPPLSAGKPVVWQLVPENKRAWHAGASYWRGATRINDTSVGIELVNRGFSHQLLGNRFYPFNTAQIDVLIPLMRAIITRYQIPAYNVVGHADIAPRRKVDPGPLFPWARLAQNGIGAWPDAGRVAFYQAGLPDTQEVNRTRLLNVLADYGYAVAPVSDSDQQTAVISAFQMHFRPADYRGIADAQTLAIAEALREKYPRGHKH